MDDVKLREFFSRYGQFAPNRSTLLGVVVGGGRPTMGVFHGRAV